MKHKFKRGDGFIGTPEERVILQKLIKRKGYNGTSGFYDCITGYNFFWNGKEFYLTNNEKLMTNIISFEVFKNLLSDNPILEPHYDIY